MGILEIHCHECGTVYEVLPECVMERDTLPNGLHPYCCPHCFAQMNTRTWNKLVRAYGELQDINRELLKDHIGYRDHPLFQAAYKSLGIPLHEDFSRD